MKNIGIVCEGPTDYIILQKVINLITNETNYYVQLQPEPDLTGQYGNGWKGVWKWCCDNADIRKQLMKDRYYAQAGFSGRSNGWRCISEGKICSLFVSVCQMSL